MTDVISIPINLYEIVGELTFEYDESESFIIYIWILPEELTHIICSYLTMFEVVKLMRCSKLLNLQIDNDNFWKKLYINNFNEKILPENEGNYKSLYSAKHLELYDKRVDDRFLLIIQKSYYNLIYDVLNSENFMIRLQYDPIIYLKEILKYPHQIQMLTILFNNNWDLQEYKDKLLFVAAEKKLLDVCKFLMLNGATIQYITQTKNNALSVCAKAGNFDLCKILIENGTLVDVPNANSALYFAAQGGYWEIVSYLISKGVDVEKMYDNEPPLYVAILKGHVKCVEELVKGGCNINVIVRGRSMIYLASKLGFEKIVQLLMDNNVDVNVRFEHRTPLYVAALQGKYKAVEMLCSYDSVDIDEICNDKTALFIACEKGYVDIVRVLLQNGANVNHKWYNGTGMLHIACKLNNPDLVGLLCSFGVEIDYKSQHMAVDGCSRLLNFYSSVREADKPKDEFKNMMEYYNNIICGI